MSRKILVNCELSCQALPNLDGSSVCHLTVWYHHRSVRRRRKCSRANEVLNLQRILPSEQKRKIKVHNGQQVLRITGSRLMPKKSVTAPNRQYVCVQEAQYVETQNLSYFCVFMQFRIRKTLQHIVQTLTIWTVSHFVQGLSFSSYLILCQVSFKL